MQQYDLLTDEHNALLDAARELIEGDRLVLTHQDFHFGQVMTDGREVFYVIDWTDAGAGYPGADLGYCIAAARRYWRIPRAYCDRVIAGYCAVSPMDRDACKAVSTWERYTLLHYAGGCAENGKQEDLQHILALLAADI